jgi:glucose-6-phosphate 1-dehydrogenase
MKTKLIIFGITGDLSQRKLVPVLEQVIQEVSDLQIIGVSRREVEVKDVVTEPLVNATSMFTMDLAKATDYDRLKDYLALKDGEQALVYLSVPPSAAADIVDFLGQAGLNGENIKLLFEKPFGFDFESAKEFLDRTARYFSEKQIYRIDHYAAKEISQRLIELRANDETHHHHWSNQSVAAVEIIASETIGVEDRAFFYEQTGALRDFLQGHLLQLLALVLMDVSGDFGLDVLPARRLTALNFLQPANPELTERAQYDGYAQAVENSGSLTETFVNMQLESDDPRWKDVPLTLTTGKALDKKRSLICIHYNDGSEEQFDEASILPAEGRKRDAYERVILEAIQGNKAIFTTGPEVLRAWEIVKPVQTEWGLDDQPLPLYKQGSTIDEVLDSVE